MQQLSYISILCSLSYLLLVFPATAQQEGKGHPGKHGKGHAKEQPGKGHGKNQAKGNEAGHGQGQDKKAGTFPDDEADKGKPQKDKHAKHEKHGDLKQKQQDERAGKSEADHEENKAGRHQITVCHKPGGKGAGGITISVSERAWKAHQAHGDTRGACPNRATEGKAEKPDKVEKKQADFYSKVTAADEKVYDAEDLLAAARARMRKAQERLEAASKTKSLPEAEMQQQQSAISRTASLITELGQLVTETRQNIKTDLERVEASL